MCGRVPVSTGAFGRSRVLRARKLWAHTGTVGGKGLINIGIDSTPYSEGVVAGVSHRGLFAGFTRTTLSHSSLQCHAPRHAAVPNSMLFIHTRKIINSK